MATATPTVGAERAALIDSIEAMLRPLMPLVLNYGVTYADAQDVLRALFVETMGERIRQQGREASIGRIAVMAGLNRGEVEKLGEDREQRQLARTRRMAHADDVSRILTSWHEDPRFNTPYGAPLDLSLEKEEGFRTLSDLMATACPGADKELILDELVASGSVDIHDGKFIRPASRAALSSSSDTTMVARLGRQVSALTRTITHNLLREDSQETYLERGITTSSLVSSEFRSAALEYLREQGKAFVDNADRWVTDNERGHEDPNGSMVGFGLFFYEEPREVDSAGNSKRIIQ